MKLLDITILSAEGLRERKFRVALNVLGILVGCAAVTGLVSLADGMNTQVRDQMSVIGTNTLFVIPEDAKEAAMTISATQIASQDGISWRDRETIQDTGGVRDTCEIIMGGGSYTIKGETYSARVMGVGDSFREINKDVKMTDGRFFTRGDKAVAFVGKNVAHPTDEEEPILGVGNRIKLAVKVRGEHKEITLRVVGVLAEHGTMFGLDVDNVIGIPFRTYDQLFEQGGSCAIVQVYARESSDTEEVAKDLEDRLGDDFFVVSPKAAIEVQEQVTGTIQAVLGGVATISLFVAGLGIVNTMTVSVNERTREIGTMKAIGANSVDILLLFISEAAYTGLMGGVAGSAVGFTLGKMVGNYIGLPVGHSLSLGSAVVAFALVTSVLSGAGPAYRASRMDPVKALRSE
ncbi:ABC transporter permease [Candidatus Bathyarchaeota archaeon]|nr:ABC transporter permease [Candidatus Bathyarchaeota archaeon]